MTLILACAAPEGLVLASDTLVCTDWHKSWIDKKWGKVGKWNVAVSGNASLHQALEFGNDEPPPTTIEQVVRWARRALSFNGINPTKDDDGTDVYRGRFIFAREKEIWMLGSDLHASPVKPGEWAAIGSGFEYALGAISAMKNYSQVVGAADIARIVLGIVESHTNTVAGCYINTIPYDPHGYIERERAISKRAAPMVVTDR